MQKNRYWIVTALNLLLLSVIPAVLLIWGFLLPAQYEDSFLGELKYKYRLLKETPGSRIVVVGGSSVAFGVDSGLISEQFPGYKAVNFGMYAALGTELMLDLSKDWIREGDIVIISPEQQKQTLSSYYNGEYMWQALDGGFEMLPCVGREAYGKLLGKFPAFAAGKFRYWMRGETLQLTGVYRRASFDGNGDMAADLCLKNEMAGGYDPTTPILFDRALLEESFLQALNDYCDALTERGAAVYYRFSPMNALAVEEGADPDTYYDFLQEKLHCRILGDPHTCILDAAWFYDTNFHLNASGKILNTRQLVRDLKAELGITAVTNIAVPKMPEFAVQELKEGDNSDADCFLVVCFDGEAKVIGLTEKGRAQKTLTVPAVWQGCPVMTIGTGAFSDHALLESVTVQENVGLIEDGAFEGCASLKELILLCSDPQRCMTGQELERGADFVIRVPAQAVDTYKLDYTWSKYAARIQETE